MEGERKTKQYLTIGEKAFGEKKEIALRTSKIQCISRNCRDLIDSDDWSPSEEGVEKAWKICKERAGENVTKHWENRLCWESGPNPPYLQTQFINYRKEGKLELILHNDFLNIQMELALTTDDKIAMLDAINKENNRIKSALEKDKVKEYEPKEVDCDRITSKEKGDGIEWTYYKDGKSTGTAFMTYKQLYEIQIGQHTSHCQFCDSTMTRSYCPRDNDTAILLCSQHEKYIQRVSQRINGKANEV